MRRHGHACREPRAHGPFLPAGPALANAAGPGEQLPSQWHVVADAFLGGWVYEGGVVVSVLNTHGLHFSCHCALKNALWQLFTWR